MFLLLRNERFSRKKSQNTPKLTFTQSLLNTPARNGACTSTACHVIGVGTHLEGTVWVILK